MSAAKTRQDREKGAVAVKLVRGPFVRLEPHEQSCESEGEFLELTNRLRESEPLAADLFCGGGGFSLGLEDAGFRVVLGVDTDADALETHAHYFGGLTRRWDLGEEENIQRVAGLLKRADIALVAGGPPCQPFSKAGRSLLRDLVRTGRRPRHDHRRDLWQGFLEVVRRSTPPAVLLENVPDMALDREMLILRTLVDELEGMGYAVECDIVDSSKYGVPQYRQRLILVALRDGLAFSWPEEVPDPVLLRHAISDLPHVEGGWRSEKGADGWLPYEGPKSSLQERLRKSVPKSEEGRIYDHITRPVREDDAQAFERMDSSTSYADLPEELKRYRDDIFDDKYKRLDWDELSRTITAHIAKDGYWYIHPDQERTLTVREAARVQTFPDHYRFAGSPTSAFRQIGNAVPPRLAEILAQGIRLSLEEGRRKVRHYTRALSETLAGWVSEQLKDGSLTPWFRKAASHLVSGEYPPLHLRWHLLLGEVLLDRVSLPPARLERIWQQLERDYGDPGKVVENSDLLVSIGYGLGRESRVDQIRELAGWFAEDPQRLGSYAAIAEAPGLTGALADLAVRMVPDPDSDAIIAPKAAVRVAARVLGTEVDTFRVRSSGRIAVARLVGVDDDGGGETQGMVSLRGSLAHIALVELGRHVCTPSRPACSHCPLNQECSSRSALESQNLRLDLGS